MIRHDARASCAALSIALAGAIAGAAAPSARAGEFVDGDLYLISMALPHPNPPPSSIIGALRINTATMQTTLLPLASSGMVGRGTYDPFRNGLVLVKANLASPILVDADGNITDLGVIWDQDMRQVASRGDGILYVVGLSKLGYVDAANVMHNVLDQAGAAPFLHGVSQSVQSSIIFDAPTNALFLADPDGFGGTRVQRIPLTPDGTQVAASVTANTFDGSTASNELPVGFSAMPDGNLLLKIDDNSNTLQARMLIVDPANGSISPFAMSNYAGVAGEVAGTFSRVLGKAVVLDSFNDQLRLFNPGESGRGAIWLGNVSSSGSGEVARLVEIGGTIGGGPACRGDVGPGSGGDGTVDVNDLLQIISAWGPCPPPPSTCPADINNDSSVDVTDLLAVISTWGPCP